jgi:outer membrane receptor protein involved in Fe transport
MRKQKIFWLGLLAIATIAPVLVAQSEPLAPKFSLGSPEASSESKAPPAKPSVSPSPSASEEPIDAPRWRTGSDRSAAPPALPVLTGGPSGRIILTGGQPDDKKGPDTTPAAPTPPASGLASLQSFYGLPSAAPSVPSAAQAQAPSQSTNVSGQSAVPSSGVGNLLANSNSAQGVEVQRRSPLVGDPRIEGLHFGQIVTQADGAYWFPARVDLDTVVSKLNSSDINNILIIKGPFSVRYGPGFSFMDIESLPTPRYSQGYFDAHGSTSFGYRTQGDGFQGQQAVWGGNADWGFRISYDLQSAGDYTSGNGSKLPSSYNNQFVNFALGIDLSRCESLEVKYLHVQQNNVLFPGLLTDVNNLVTDGFAARYKAVEGHWYDQLTVDTWVNTTRFNGDSANPQTRAQIPQLDNIFPANLSANNAALAAAFGPVRLDINTDGNAISYGVREITTWGDAKGFNLSLGADVRVFQSNYNEYDAFNLSVLPGTGLPANLGIPNGRQIDPGIFADTSMPLGEKTVIKAGARVDFTTTQFLGFGPNVDQASYTSVVGEPVDRAFLLFSGFATAETKLNSVWSAQAGYGYAERPPTLTELYSGGAFFGLIQNGFNSIYGNPLLRKEEMHQLNVGLTAKDEDVRLGGNAFYAFMPNYITYDNLGPFVVGNITAPTIGTVSGTTPINQLRFVNTRLATLYGFDAYAEYDAFPWLTPFATLSFVEGWDQTRNEALPGIAPLDTRAGLRFHEPGTNPRWGVEYVARMVATQDLFAESLGEQRTGGFVVHNVRAYWQPRDNLLLLAGVENIGNLQYREHLDLRTGLGVYQPGINFYVGMKVSY